MRYRLPLRNVPTTQVPSITGAMIVPVAPPSFYAWLPSTWPAPPKAVDPAFIDTLSKIFGTAVLGEITNVITDIQASNGSLEQRGHVIGIALMCALDSISSYGYRGHKVGKFVKAHFPAEYRPFADDLYNLYRLSLVHSWNLFAATLYPDQTPIHNENGTLAFGLLHFTDALVAATEDFLNTLATNTELQGNTLRRYKELKQQTRS